MKHKKCVHINKKEENELMSNTKRFLSAVMAFVMVLSMFSGLGGIFAKNEAFVPTASAAEGTSKIDSYADLAAAYDNFVYLGLEFYEQDTAGDWFLTDYYVKPGQSLKMYVYVKTDMYLGQGSPYFIFERSFFDVTNGATNLTYDNTYDPDHADYPTEGYPAVFNGTMNPNHSAVTTAGVTVTMTTKWARNINGFTEKTATNWHGIDLAESDTWDFIFGSWGRDGTALTSWEAKDDAYYYDYTLKVREFMPDGVTKLADGTTGFVKNDHRLFKRYDPSTMSSKRVSNIAVAETQLNYGQIPLNNKADYLTLENILIDDCNHTFTIGNPPVAGSDFTATFEVDGETYGDPVKVAKGGEIAAPATDPVKAGYAFKGWALKGTTDTLTFPQTMGDADVTYVAIFEELATYTATFMVDGAVYGDVKSYYAGDAIVAPADPSKTGYTFAGWNPTVGTMGEADVVFNATWTAKTYTATFLAEDVYETVATFDQPYILPEETPVKEGYTFAGWYADEDCTEAMPSTHTVADDVIFYAKWDINSYTITFDVDGGSAVAPITAPFGTAITEPAAPTKNGYTFAGWSPALPATMPAENITVKAQWTAVASGIQLMDGDAEYDFIEGVYGDQITSLPTLTKDGFTFNGWTYADGSAVTYPITLGTAAITVYAKWTAKAYYIDFYGPGEGDWITGSSQLCGAVIETPDAPTKAGYQFIGWVDADGNPMPETVPAIDNQAYYAKYEAISYDALFLVDGEEYDKVSGIVGTSIAAPADAPAKEGHTFKYWAKAGTTTKVNFPQTMPINGVSYDAIFDVNTYTVTWVVDGVEVGTTQVKYGEAITDFAYTAPEGSSFGGWLDKPATMPATDITVNGTCATQSFTVTFKIDGDAEFEQVLTFAYGAKVTAPAYEVPTGYSFSGWDLPATMPAQDLVLTATLTANTYYAIFYLDDDMTEEYAKDGYNYGDTIAMPEAPTKPGYTFDGWDNDATTMGIEDEIYVAMWTAIPYDVVFNAADGSVADEWVAYYGDVITEDDLPEVTKEGFDFSGWKVDGEYVAFPYTVTGNVTFEPAFGTHVYTITYYVDGEVAYTDKYEFGAAVTARPAEVKEGYTFSGWDVEIPATMPANDITVNGTFTVNQYDALFYADGVLIDTVATNFGEVPVAPEAPAKVGYTFVGWTPALAPMTTAGAIYEARYSAGAVTYTVETYTMGLDGAYGEPAVETKSAEADAAISVDPVAINGFTIDEENSVLSGTAAADGSSVLKVYYIRNQYTFKTVVDGVEDAIVYYFGADVAAPADPAKEGYTFTGWDGSIPATMPARDVTLTARFTVNQYTITFAETGDKVIPSITQDYGTAVVAPADPTKTGYTFAGWDNEIPATIPAKDITITALWTINQYTITFANTGDTVIDAITDDYGTAVVAPAAPTKVGYTFAGWDVEIPATIPAADITITAQWTINQYDAIFVIDGKEVVVPTDYNTVPVAPEATKYGYSFTGWDKEIVAIGTEAVTYTAQFEANTYNATFKLDGGNIDGDTADVIVPTVFDKAVVAPADPKKEGYIFAGWTPAVGNMTSEDGIVYTATWTQNLDYCRVQNVERVTADVYEAERALYEIKVMGSPVKLQVIHADNQSVTWTYDRNDAKVAGDLTASGLVKIVGYTAANAVAGEGDAVAYEIWTICTVLTEGNYKVRAKVDYSSTSWESIAFAYDYVCEYDKMPVEEDIITSATGPETIKRGTEGTIVIVASETVTRMRLKMDKGDGTYTTVSYAPTSTAVETSTADGKTTWNIKITFTYSGTAESQQQNWVVWYRTADVAWTETEYVVPVKVTRYAAVSENAGGHAPYSVISVSAPADTIKGEATTITIVTTNDISRIKLSYDGRSSTYLKTSNSVSVVEDATAGTYTWTVTYKFGVIADGQVWSVQCRGTSWSTVDDGDKFTINVASNV